MSESENIPKPNWDEPENVFEAALVAAVAAFQDTLDKHFGRTYDGSDADYARLLAEYRESKLVLGDEPTIEHLATGLVDAQFACWLSDVADENFGEAP